MSTTTDLRQLMERNIALIEKAVELGQNRLAMRALRQTTPIRKRITASALVEIIENCSEEIREITINELRAVVAKSPQAMEFDEEENAAATKIKIDDNDQMETEEDIIEEKKSAQLNYFLPEVEAYLLMLTGAVLCREGNFDGAGRMISTSLPKLKQMSSRRTAEPLIAKIYFYYALAHEKMDQFEKIRPILLALHRSACLRHDEFCQAVILNALVRGLLQGNFIEAAYKLVSKTNFPENASNNQFCRYLYYTGRIQAVQLDYTDAYTKLMQSMRKAPATCGVGFRRSVQQLAILVQLLMGELPLRSMFQGPGISGYLDPYLRLTHAVRRGHLDEFNRVLAQNAQRFKHDKTYTLAIRLSQNVVKTGLRQINISYSRISIKDVTAKLQLESERSTEFVIAKAIKDGVIEATIDHENKWMCSKQVADIYSTDDPQKAFHRRIAFCLDVHNEAIKAMMYPPDAHKSQKPQSKPDSETKTDEELAKEIEDVLEDDPPI